MRRIKSIGMPVLLVLAPLVLISPVLFTGKALFWGTPALQFVPWREFAWSTIRQGHLPLWNPWLGMGAPLFANYQSALAYPLNWLLFFLSSLGGVEWHAWGQALVVALHWIIAGFGMRRLAKDLGLGELSQVIAGLAYSLSGYLVARAGFLSINAATAWLPWILLYSGRIASPRFRKSSLKSRCIGLFSLVVGLLSLSGHAQVAWYSCLLALIWGGYWAAVDVDETPGVPPGRIRQLRLASLASAGFWLGVGFFGAIILSSVQLIPTAEYLSQSQRAAAVDFEYAMTYSFWPWRLLTMLAPDLFGTPVRGDYWGYGSYWEDALYLGLLPLLLAVSTSARWLKQRWLRAVHPRTDPSFYKPSVPRLGAVPFLLILILVSMLFALGKNTPLFPWLYHHVPTFDMFQAPTRFSLWAEFAFALLAGVGVDAWRRPQKRSLYWTRLSVAGAAAVTIGAWLTWHFLAEVSPTFIRSIAIAGMLGIGAGVLSLLAPPAGGRIEVGWWHWLVAVFIAADLVAAGWGLNPGVEREFYSQEVNQAALLQELEPGRRIYMPSSVEQILKFDRYLRFDTYDPGVSWSSMRQAELPNLNMLDRIPSVNNFDPLLPGRYARWADLLDHANSTQMDSMLDISGVGVVLGLDAGQEAGTSFHPLGEGMGRRLRWVPCGVSAEDENKAFELVGSLSFDPDIEVILEGWSAPPSQHCIPDAPTGDLRMLSEDPGRLVVESSAEKPGWLLLSDVWYPGWQVFVDGELQPVYRADYLFRAVKLESGDHRIVFEYRPGSFYAGALISLGALCALVLGIAARIIRKYSSSSRS